MRTLRSLLTAAVLCAAIALLAAAPPVRARADDVCPEPNNSFQAACFLGRESDALGFISAPDDTDAYRIEVLDFDTVLQVSLERPAPYRVELANETGAVIAGSADGRFEHRIGPPGIYYLFVDSPTGQFNPSTPYRIERRLNYPAEIPILLMAAEWRGAPSEVFTQSGSTTLSDELGDYSIDGGRITLAMKVGGTDDEPVAAKFHLPPEPPDPGPIVTDFAMTIDARVENSPNAGYEVLFRYRDDDNYYAVAVNTGSQEVALYKVVDGEHVDIAEWTHVPGIGGTSVYRTTVRCVGPEIRVYLGNIGVIRWTDDSHKEGMVGFGAVTWGAPPKVTIDNIVVTTPTYR